MNYITVDRISFHGKSDIYIITNCKNIQLILQLKQLGNLCFKNKNEEFKMFFNLFISIIEN